MLSLFQLSNNFHRCFFNIFHGQSLTPKKLLSPRPICRHRHAQDLQRQIPINFSITEKNTQGDYFPITVTEKRAMRIFAMTVSQNPDFRIISVIFLAPKGIRSQNLRGIAKCRACPRMPWGGGGTPHEEHPSQKRVLDPASSGAFSIPPLRGHCSAFQWKSLRCVLWQVFLPPYVLHPHIMALRNLPRATGVSRALRARNPKKVSKEPPGASGPDPKSLEKVSKKS